MRPLCCSLAPCVLLLAALAVVTGCPGSSSAPTRSREEARIQATTERLQERREAIREAIRSQPLRARRLASECQQLEAQARAIGRGDLERDFQRLQEQAREAFEQAAESETRSALARVRELMREGDLRAAETHLQQLAALLDDTPHLALVEAERERLTLARRADRVYEDVIQRKLFDLENAGDWEVVRGLLESFFVIDAFQASSYADEAKARLEEVLPKAEALRERRLREREIAWQPVFRGERADMQQLDYSDWRAASFEDGEIHFTTEGFRESLMYGEEEWEDYLVEVVFHLERGAAHFLFRGMLLGDEEEGFERSWSGGMSLRAGRYPDDDYIRIRFAVREGHVHWTVLGSRPEVGAAGLGNARGPFAIFLDPGSEMWIKEIWVKPLPEA